MTDFGSVNCKALQEVNASYNNLTSTTFLNCQGLEAVMLQWNKIQEYTLKNQYQLQRIDLTT